MEISLLEDAKKLEQKRLAKKQSLNLPNIKQHEIIYNQSSNNLNTINNEDQKNNKSIEAEKNLEYLHKEIKIGEIFDKFKSIVNYNADICKKSELELLRNSQNNNNKKLFSRIKDTSFLHSGKNGYLPKINNNNYNCIKSMDKICEQNSENWSPIDIKNNNNNKNKNKLEKLKGFSVKNRQINFKKNDSIFLTNNNNNINTDNNIFIPTRDKTNLITNDNYNNNSFLFERKSLCEYDYNNNNNNCDNNNLLTNNVNKSIISNDNNRINQSMNSSVFEF